MKKFENEDDEDQRRCNYQITVQQCEIHIAAPQIMMCANDQKISPASEKIKGLFSGYFFRDILNRWFDMS